MLRFIPFCTRHDIELTVVDDPFIQPDLDKLTFTVEVTLFKCPASSSGTACMGGWALTAMYV